MFRSIQNRKALNYKGLLTSETKTLLRGVVQDQKDKNPNESKQLDNYLSPIVSVSSLLVGC